MSNIDYNELLCEAIDTIVSSRLRDLSFDETIVCTITAIVDKDKGQYEVSDGSTVFIAINGTEREYSERDKVYVLIPRADYTQKKTITGPYRDENDKPIGYSAPSEKIIELVTVYPKSQDTDDSSLELGLIANGEGENVLQTIELFDRYFNEGENNDGRITISDGIYIQAKFKSLLDSYEHISGSYGIVLELYHDNNSKPFSILTLDSARDMFGNPYSYTVPSVQEVSYRLAATDSEQLIPIYRIRGYFYQRGNFVTKKGGKNVPLIASQGNNLYVSDVKVGLGLNVENVTNCTVKLIGLTSAQYTSQNPYKQVSLLWINKTDSNKYIGFSDGIFACTQQEIAYAKGTETIAVTDNNNYYYIEWMCDIQSGVRNKLDELDNNVSVTIPCSTKLSFTGVNATVWRNGIAYTPSADLIFSNTGGVAADPFANLGIKLILEHGENSQSFYSLYGGDNKILDTVESNREREIRWSWSYENGVIDDSFWKDAVVQWTLPKGATMITYDEKYHKPLKIGVDTTMPDARYFKYKIKDIYSSNNINNNITCTITLGEEKHAISASLLLLFQPFGTIGTTYTLTVKPSTERVFGFIEEDGIGTVKEDYHGILYDSDGKEMNTEVSLLYHPISNEKFQIDQFNMVKASSYQNWNGNRVNLTTYYPITYSKNGQYYAEVPTKISYDSFGKIQGQPIIDLKLFDFQSNAEIYNCEWEVRGISSSLIKDEIFVSNKEPETIRYYGISYFDVTNKKRILEVEVSNIEYQLTDIEKFSFLNGDLINIKFQDDITVDENKDCYLVLKNSSTHETKMSLAPVATLANVEWIEYEILTLDYYNGELRVYEIIDRTVLKVPPMFLTNFNTAYPYLIAKINDSIVWTSPLLLQQYVYQSDVLNEWNGSFTLDENGNRILAASGVFGSKNSNNNFTGVILGDIGEDYLNSYQSGLIGMDDGKQSFGFLTDGTGFIGPSGKGRIFFDGSGKGIIAGGGWLGDDGVPAFEIRPNTSGTKINFADGEFSFNSANGGYLTLKNNKFSAQLDELNFIVGDESKTTKSYLEIIDDRISSAVTQNINYTGLSRFDKINKLRTLEIEIDNENLFNQISNDVNFKFTQGTIFSIYFVDGRQIDKDENNNYKKNDEGKYEGDEGLEVKFNVIFKYKTHQYEYKNNPLILNPLKLWESDETIGLVYKENITLGGYLSFISVSSSEIEQTAESITMTVMNELTGEGSAIDQRFDSITASVENQNDTIANFQITANNIFTSVQESVGFQNCVMRYNDDLEKFQLYITVTQTFYDTMFPEEFFPEGTLFTINMDCPLPQEISSRETEVFIQVKRYSDGGEDIDQKQINNYQPIILAYEDWKTNERINFEYTILGEYGQCIIPTQISSSYLKQLSDQFVASVSTDNESFSWSLTSSGFYLSPKEEANSNNYVFKCDGGGVEVKGTIIAESGNIGTWDIRTDDDGSWLQTNNGYDDNGNALIIQNDYSGVAIHRPERFDSHETLADTFLICRQYNEETGEYKDNFIVYGDGHVVAENINIVGGVQNINNKFIVNENGTLTSKDAIFIDDASLSQVAIKQGSISFLNKADSSQDWKERLILTHDYIEFGNYGGRLSYFEKRYNNWGTDKDIGLRLEYKQSPNLVETWSNLYELKLRWMGPYTDNGLTYYNLVGVPLDA